MFTLWLKCPLTIAKLYIMAARKKKYVEVLTPRVKCFSQNDSEITFSDILSYMSGKTVYYNEKEYIVRTYGSDNLENCIEGIVVTGQNKDIPPKRNDQTGEFSALSVDIDHEKLSFGNAFLYDKELNILFYKRNKNGCFIDTLAKFFTQIWNQNEEEHEDIKIELDFNAILRKGEYERAIKMGYYKEFIAEFTCPKAILEELEYDKSSLYGISKKCATEAVKAKSDRFEIKISTFGKQVNKDGLSIRTIKEYLRSVRTLLKGRMKSNVEKVRIKGYSSDPEDSSSIQTIDLVADVFKPYFRLTSNSLNSNLQEVERRQELRKVYQNIRQEVARCISNE